MKYQSAKTLLEPLVNQFNQSSFIAPDPISVPHRFTKKQDIEISGLFAALLAWGQRTTIINNANRLMDLMDGSPHDFILNHLEVDRKRFETFVHRTFQPVDLLYFIESLQQQYQRHDSLETLFADGMTYNDEHVGNGLIHFHKAFFAYPHLSRTEKHLQNPERKSACKRINLFLRWMVRKDNAGVDFGIWQRIKPAQLLCPLDVHVQRTAIDLGILKRTQSDWQACLELTEVLRKWDPVDPVKYDFALFGLGLERE
jgi:uncharacterized protein (TIGR02757 family)